MSQRSGLRTDLTPILKDLPIFGIYSTVLAWLNNADLFTLASLDMPRLDLLPQIFEFDISAPFCYKWKVSDGLIEFPIVSPEAAISILSASM